MRRRRPAVPPPPGLRPDERAPAVIALRNGVALALRAVLACLVLPASTAGAADSSNSTAKVLCDYRTRDFNRSPAVNATSRSSWRCDGASRVLSANGLPDHEVGSFPNPGNPSKISAQTVAATITLTPAVANPQGARSKTAGYVLNGVKLDPGTAGTCNDSGTACDPGGGTGAWRMEALGQSSFAFGTDANHAHVQPDGNYHYHGIPEGFVAKLGKGRAMTLIGWAMDGFPIYARYGHADADDANSAITVLTGSYRHKAAPDAGRPPTGAYPMGSFAHDWQYVAVSATSTSATGAPASRRSFRTASTTTTRRTPICSCSAASRVRWRLAARRPHSAPPHPAADAGRWHPPRGRSPSSLHIRCLT
jgi:hypothetical protein